MYYENPIRFEVMLLSPGPTWSLTFYWPPAPSDTGPLPETVTGSTAEACYSAAAARVEAWRASERKKVEADRG